MRLILAALCLATMSGCACGPTTEPVLELKSPLWFRSQPVMQPQGYVIAQPAAAQYVEVPRVQAPAYQYAPVQQRAVGPCGDGGQPYSPPPVPGDVPESIPAFRSR
jgi:hypothetical protein